MNSIIFSRAYLLLVNKLISNENELHQINPDVVQDPTLPRTNSISCPNCGYNVSGKDFYKAMNLIVCQCFFNLTPPTRTLE